MLRENKILIIKEKKFLQILVDRSMTFLLIIVNQPVWNDISLVKHPLPLKWLGQINSNCRAYVLRANRFYLECLESFVSQFAIKIPWNPLTHFHFSENREAFENPFENVLSNIYATLCSLINFDRMIRNDFIII